MAKKTKWANLWIDLIRTINGLATKTASTQSAGYTLRKSCYLKKVRFGGLFLSTALTSGEGPVLVGLAASTMSATTIKEALEVNPTGPMSDDQLTLAGRMRSIAVLGLIGAHPAGVGEVAYMDCAGKELNITIPEGLDINFWVYNPTSGAFTTGAVTFTGQLLGIWED